MNAPFATVSDVAALTGKAYTAAEQERLATMLPMLSDALRVDAAQFGADLDAQAAASEAYTNLLTLVTVDIAVRAMRQSLDAEPMSQETQSALGYSWSGTYAVPGGGIAASIMNNDRKRLGYLRQRYGVTEFYGHCN